MNTSNIDHVTAWLGAFVDSFDFKRVGNDQSLGRDVANKVVDCIQNRSLQDAGVRPGTGCLTPRNTLYGRKRLTASVNRTAGPARCSVRNRCSAARRLNPKKSR